MSQAKKSSVFPLYESVTASIPSRYVSLAEVVAMAAAPSVGPKTGAPVLTPYHASAKTKEAALGAMYHALILDHDDDDLTAEQLRQRYDGYGCAYLAYTSASHRQDKGGTVGSRWKVVIPLAAPVEYERYIALAAGAALHHGADPAQARGQQVFFAPNKLSANAPYKFIDCTARQYLDPDAAGNALIAGAVSAYQQEQDRRTSVVKRSEAKPRPADAGGDGIISKVCRQFDLESELEAHGYRRVGRKYLSPESSTGQPGVHLLKGEDGRERLYSHHGGTDPLSSLNHGGHSLDVFDVLTVLEYGGDVSRAVAGLAPRVDPDGQRRRQREHMAAQGIEQAKPDPEPPVWPDLADPFTEHVAPPFPLGVLPDCLQDFATEKARQSGFDPGGYAFCLLVAAGNTVDHRSTLDIGPFRVPPYMWGGLVAKSGGGKSPVMRASIAHACRINDDIVRESNEQLAKWRRACAAAKEEKREEPPRPPWKQRHALDTTTESLAGLLVDNPEGVNMYMDEITELLGRMDAYSGKDGGKDRGVYLRAYDGGQVTVNRVSRQQPLVVENFSVGILAGIQPEVLAAKFKKGGGQGADGLYQRFMPYCLAPPGEVDYTARANPFIDREAADVFVTIQRWNEEGRCLNASLSHGAQRKMQEYHNKVRVLSQRTASSRFAEHLDKFPGFLGRVAFALHVIHAAANREPPDRTLTPETMDRALSVVRVLYRHSEAVYSVLDAVSGDVLGLVRSAAEAILSKRWERFQRGDLTRHATHWQGADRHEAENAIDYLIELGWIADVTPPPIAGKRGRKSDGLFQVNPVAGQQFARHAERISRARSERYQALRSVAGSN